MTLPSFSKNLFGTWKIAIIVPPLGHQATCRLPAGRHHGLPGERRPEARDGEPLRVGAFADLVVFDPAKILDRATFTEPLRHPEGIRMVFVNGQLAVDADRLTGVRAGRVLRHTTARSGA